MDNKGSERISVKKEENEISDGKKGKNISTLRYLWCKLMEYKKWLAIIVTLLPILIVILSTVIDVLLFNAVPSTDGEFRFRDIRTTSNETKWNIFTNTQGDHWKARVSSTLINEMKNEKKEGDDKNEEREQLGSYEIVSATVFTQSRGHSKRSSPIGPIDSRFISLFLKKQGRPSLFLTLDKAPEAPEIVKSVVGGANHGGIYAQLSDSRDASLQSVSGEFRRGNIDIGTVRWRALPGSVVTLEGFLQYYTQTSSHLAPCYNYYSRNSKHFVVAVVKLLKQLQDFNLGSMASADMDEEGSVSGGFLQLIATKAFNALGAAEL